MIFNQLHNAARLWMPAVLPVVDAAVRINFPIDPHKILPNRMSTWNLMSAGQFKLPYRIVALEDLASCVIIADLSTDQVGLGDDRIFIECIPSGPGVSQEHYNDNPEAARHMSSMCATMPADTVIVTVGRFSSAAQEHNSYLVDGVISYAMVCSQDSLLVPPWAFDELSDQDRRGTTESALRNSMTALEELMFLQNLPGFTGWPDLQQPVTLNASTDGRIVISN